MLGSCREVDSDQEILGTMRHCVFVRYSTNDRQVPTVCQVLSVSLRDVLWVLPLSCQL